MGVGSAISAVSTAVDVGSSLLSGSSDKKEARHQEHLSKKAAAQALEREQAEKEMRREQIEYEANLAAEQSQREIGVSLEKAKYTKERINEEAAMVRAAQIVGYAASGIDISSGSPVSVMQRTARISSLEKRAVTRGHEIFAQTRTIEAEQVEEGGELTYEWFTNRLRRETQYEVESRLGEADRYRKKQQNIQYGSYFNIASTAIPSISKLIEPKVPVE